MKNSTLLLLSSALPLLKGTATWYSSIRMQSDYRTDFRCNFASKKLPTPFLNHSWRRLKRQQESFVAGDSVDFDHLQPDVEADQVLGAPPDLKVQGLRIGYRNPRYRRNWDPWYKMNWVHTGVVQGYSRNWVHMASGAQGYGGKEGMGTRVAAGYANIW